MLAGEEASDDATELAGFGDLLSLPVLLVGAGFLGAQLIRWKKDEDDDNESSREDSGGRQFDSGDDPLMGMDDDLDLNYYLAEKGIVIDRLPKRNENRRVSYAY